MTLTTLLVNISLLSCCRTEKIFFRNKGDVSFTNSIFQSVSKRFFMRYYYESYLSNNHNTVDARYLEHLLSRTFTISNFVTDPLNFSSNSKLKNIRYLELRYLELSLSRTNYLSLKLFFARYLELLFEFLNWNVRTMFVFFSPRFFVVSTWQSK